MIVRTPRRRGRADVVSGDVDHLDERRRANRENRHRFTGSEPGARSAVRVTILLALRSFRSPAADSLIPGEIGERVAVDLVAEGAIGDRLGELGGALAPPTRCSCLSGGPPDGKLVFASRRGSGLAPARGDLPPIGLATMRWVCLRFVVPYANLSPDGNARVLDRTRRDGLAASLSDLARRREANR